MGLNIKNEHVHALAREAARRTGTNQTSAIERALEEFLARLDASTEEGAAGDPRRARVERVLDRVDALVTHADRLRVKELQDRMYDEAGLPTW